MKLLYSILWFDDNKEYIEETSEYLSDFLDELGFDLEVTSYSDSNYPQGTISDPKWNLILMDFELNNGTIGTQIINDIRSHNVYTEIVFYSAHEKLIENIRSLSLEGVYWADRSREAEEKIITIIKQTLKKTLDLDAMRGIVMATSSDIDSKMENLICLYHDCADEQNKPKIREKLHTHAIESAQSTIEKVNQTNFTTCQLHDCLDSRVLPSFRKFTYVQELTRPYKKLPQIQPLRKIFNLYNAEVIDPRNKLAHVKSKVIDGKEVISFGDFIFNDTTAQQLRTSIRKHSKNIDSLHIELEKVLNNK